MNRDIGEECNTQYDSSVGELCLASLECSNCGGEGHPTCHQPRGGQFIVSLTYLKLLVFRYIL